MTLDEHAAVNALLTAAKQLPKSICIEVDDGFGGEPNLMVWKRTGKGVAHVVASLRKKSLCF